MKISIVVPVYNEEFLIEKSLDCLIRQNYPKEDYEVVVIDDGSTDKTCEMVIKIAKKARKTGFDIKIIKLKKNSGRVRARELGVKQAKYENILFIDARCLAKENLLQKLKKIDYQPILGIATLDLQSNYLEKFNWWIRKYIYGEYFSERFKPFFMNEKNFDMTPKGTATLFCNKHLFLSATLKDKSKDASDDTKLLFNIIKVKEILKTSEIKVRYVPRSSLIKEINHVFNRGPKFVDYYLERGGKRYWYYIFTPLLVINFLLLLTISNYKIFLLLSLLVLVFTSALTILFTKSLKEGIFFVVLLFLFGTSFMLGIVKGIVIRVLK